MKEIGTYIIFGICCSAIFSTFFYLLAPEELRGYTACLFCFLSIVAIAFIAFVVSGAGGFYD